MSLSLYTHPACERHLTGPGHPERPQRLRAIRQAIEQSDLVEVITWVESPEVDRDLLSSVHASAYIAEIGRIAHDGGGWLDPDTAVSAESDVAARHAAGAAQQAAEALCTREVDRAFVPVRPPGHHALPDRGMGFCLFNNAAIGAAAARRAGRERVMIVDWDVHHGNGTQAIFWRDPSVLYVSLHQEYWYPGTGAIEEIGAGLGEGFTVNVPLPAETGDGGYADVFEEVVLPLISAYRPDLLIISVGYDAHADDPLGGMVVTAAGFGRLAALLDGAARGIDAPVLAVLEGGYHLAALGESVNATLRVLAGRPAQQPVRAAPGGAAGPREAAPAAIRGRIRAVRRLLLAHWKI
ncbi:MAG TPA: histone deacetylase [bacterium]|nr:histone deacetylase [bacterium]